MFLDTDSFTQLWGGISPRSGFISSTVTTASVSDVVQV